MFAQAFQVSQIASMYLSTGGNKGLGGFIRASETEHLMARVDQLSDDSGPYEACGACDENAHIHCPLVVGVDSFPRSVLTTRHNLGKTETVSETVDKITGGSLRLQIF